MIDVLTGQGFTPSRIENEGICISDDGGSIYSLYIFLERGLPQAYQKGIVLMKEFSTGRDAIDFRQAALVVHGV